MKAIFALSAAKYSGNANAQKPNQQLKMTLCEFRERPKAEKVLALQ
jgi:hypothetical protein